MGIPRAAQRLGKPQGIAVQTQTATQKGKNQEADLLIFDSPKTILYIS
jgi:hypothetical protein